MDKVEEAAQAAARDVWEHASTVDDNARRIAKHFRGWLPPDQVERVREALAEVYDSVPASYDPADPMVQRHAQALNAIPEALSGLPAPATREDMNR